MKAIIGLILLAIAASAQPGPDLKPTFSIRRLKTAGVDGIFDVIEIFTVLSNIGSTMTYNAPNPYPVVAIGLDSLIPLKSHEVPPGYGIAAGNFVSFLDTLQIIPRPFSITIYADPIKVYDGYSGNNVTSQGFDFHPLILVDTVKVTVHDTVKYCPPTAARQALTAKPPQSFAVYSAAGQLLKACRD